METKKNTSSGPSLNVRGYNKLKRAEAMIAGAMALIEDDTPNSCITLLDNAMMNIREITNKIGSRELHFSTVEESRKEPNLEHLY
ncbi:hypothetical protein [Ekhidna sp.]|uniref:hypothetical protein n=1 Tax=Ekhidna sp. TaxID=2608089 RepID=UPI003C7A6CA6